MGWRQRIKQQAQTIKARYRTRIRLKAEVKKKVLAEFYGFCAYCENEAEAFDHIVPYLWKPDNTEYNLVPCCKLCNGVAGSKVFDSFEDKRDYILNRRLEKMGDKDKKKTTSRIDYSFTNGDWNKKHADEKGYKVCPACHQFAVLFDKDTGKCVRCAPRKRSK